MPLVHLCCWRNCNKIIPKNQKYCDYHKSLHDKQWSQHYSKEDKRTADRVYNYTRRDQEANAFYHNKEWTKVRDYVKRRDLMRSGLSGRVLNNHDYIVDHIKPRRLCNNPFDVDNLWLLSRAEHNRKTKYEEVLPDSVLATLTRDDWKHKLSINRKHKP